MKQFYNYNLAKKVLLASGIGILSLTHSFAEVTLQVDGNTKITTINGKTIKHSLFKDSASTYTLQPGQHVITAKYDRMFKFRGGDHDYVKSGSVTVTANMANNQTYKLVWLNEPSKYEEVKDYTDNPTLAVMNGSKIVAQNTGTTDGGSGFLSGLTGLFGGNDDSDQISNQQAIAAINNNPAPNSSVPVYTSQPIVPVAVVNRANTSTLDNFMQIWLQATPDERAKIREWVQE